ncbi:MAG: DegT/DnrJ/EryC1/StrS family aminotransferase [Planctomycetota bacterium]
MNVPLLDLVRQYEAIGAELEAAAVAVLRSGRYIGGPEVDAFEAEAAAYVGAREGIGCSSGTDALLAALMALDVGPGDEVVVPSYTFFATAGSVARLGARPVFADVDPVTWNATPATVAPLLGPRTKAVVPVHLFGRAADVPALEALCGPRGIPVIEDAAQAIGGRLGERRVGAMGRVSCFSFFPSKNLGACGDGGLITTDDADLAGRLRRLRNHGQAEAYLHTEVGGNFRLDAMQAALLRVKLRHLEAWTEARRALADGWRGLFEAAGLADRVRCPADDPDRHVYHQFVVRVPAEDREACVRALGEAGVGCAVYYRVPLHRQPCFGGDAQPALPVSEELSREALALPIFPELRRDEQEYAVDVLARVLA